MQNANISAVRSLADVLFSACSYLVSYVYYLVSLCFGIFGVEYFPYSYVSYSFVFVLRVCERLQTQSLISFYCFAFLSLLEKLFGLFFSD